MSRLLAQVRAELGLVARNGEQLLLTLGIPVMLLVFFSLVDVLPTVAEVTGVKRPDTWPGRDLAPLAGVSLVPLLTGGDMGPRPPIHLLFAEDRGLRDGDWKLVSFRSEPWDLYNIAEDRTELHDLAAKHPDIVARMAKQWTDMARDVLQSPPREYREVDATAKTPRRHPEWSDYAEPAAKSTRRAAKKAKSLEPSEP